MLASVILGLLACLSLGLLLWQWVAALRFPLHTRLREPSFASPVTCLKPLKGCDASTEECLRSWFTQVYLGKIQILFGVASLDDPVCEIVRKLMAEYAHRDVELRVCAADLGPNAKVSKLAELEKFAKHEILVISDADVRVPPDLLMNAVAPFAPALKPHEERTVNLAKADLPVGLVNCLYRLANPTTLAMQWEAIAMNADFWSQVLQSKSLKPLDFALGAVMVTGRKQLDEIGGFKSLVHCLADDYQLGSRIAQQGHRIVLSPVVVDCWDPPQSLGAVWKHQLRWARTIRVCQPMPYFFSILSNATFWPLLWLLVNGTRPVLLGAIAVGIVRMLAAADLQGRLTRSRKHWRFFWLTPVKDLLQVVTWSCAFTGNRIQWRDRQYRLKRDGTLIRI